MKILVVGQGGREHTLVWKIAQSPLVEQIYCLPGNPGIAELATCPSVSFSSDTSDFSQLAEFAQREGIDLTVIGPEEPLANGIVDVFESYGLPIFGPNKRAAIIEASKDFAKGLMSKYNIPTATYQTFEQADEAIAYVEDLAQPVFVKADGLAAGKGAIPGITTLDAIKAIQRVLVDRDFGAAGQKVVIEELMEGEEASFTILTDGSNVVTLPTSQDHKRAFDNDQGQNTGGMGAYSPAPVITPELHQQVMESIVRPTIDGMKVEGRPYKGVLYIGLMITPQGPKVVEYNCRFGDPEAQVLLPRIKSDLIAAFMACINGTLAQVEIELSSEAAVCVVMASGGYPQRYQTGRQIVGLELLPPTGKTTVFHAGTATSQNGDLITNGGRVLGVSALGHDIQTAVEHAYRGVSNINFDQAHYRTDIAHRAIERVK